MGAPTLAATENEQEKTTEAAREKADPDHEGADAAAVER